ncbi:PHP domain-containing protein [Candidatus Xianfuyuplasma coldseepsis]|uniref:PHP domain-containing protein n=1 Tax=Candidatus Xianfuyuplasma coldseepsis TaxID=2782163 RepID=A0A7L7KP65_9MOLU|nr:PHP domain-containing protein [Xianfuyuplasma coldseepsis]QMS84571.1 PHP domain-containing protein [Xianfuyuplasma coldseepsis]
MKADLHMHTTYSDGRLDPKTVIKRAQQAGMDYIAITDHDTVGDVDAMVEYGHQIGIEVIPGIELSTLYQGKSVHVLGYFRDDSYHHPTMLAYYKDIKTKREKRAKRIIAKLKDYHNIYITYDEVYQNAQGIIARPHIAKAIIDRYPDYNHDRVFDELIGDHCKAYEPSVELPLSDGIQLLRKFNCVVVLAHPTLLKPHIKEAVLTHDYDGLEATYYRNKDGEEAFFTELATSRGMIITGGSDFHGIKNDSKHGDIGDIYIEGDDLDAFLNLLKKSRL